MMQRADTETIKPYPGIDLGRAYQYLLRLRSADLTQMMRSNDLMHAIGYAQRGGRASRVLGAFRQFGFADFDGTFYTFTDLAKNLLSTGTEHSANKMHALQAARFPKLYNFLYTRTNGERNVAPTEELSKAMMGGYHVKRADIEDALKNYNETLLFIDHGITFDLQKTTSRAITEKVQPRIADNMIQIDYDNNLIIEAPRDFFIKAALHALYNNESSNSVRLVPKKKEILHD